MTILKNGNGDKGARQWQIIVVVVMIVMFSSFVGVQIQQADSAIAELEHMIEKLETGHEEDIARLDESMRNRRNQIADLEERIAVVEERTKP